jgi:hypothetical protein
MKSRPRFLLLPLTLAVLVLGLGVMAGCNQSSPTAGDMTGSGDGLTDDFSTVTTKPVNALTGEKLEYFSVLDASLLDMDRNASQVVEPGETTLLRAGGGVVELEFGPKTLVKPVKISVDVRSVDGNLFFDFSPDGLRFNPEDPVEVHFFPHVVDPLDLQGMSQYSLFHEVDKGRYEKLSTYVWTMSWEDPLTGATVDEQCLGGHLEHFSKYAALR